MTHDMVLGPVMQVMRKGLDDTVVRSVLPPLDQQAVAILPMMTILADFEAPLDFDRPVISIKSPLASSTRYR